MRGRILTAMLLFTVGLSACGAPTEPHQPEDLIVYIRAAEQTEIRESWGEEAAECFTWDDYDNFVQANRAAAVADGLKATPQFEKLVTMIRAMPRAERDPLLARARSTARPTWAMMGRISPSGTTDAGRMAGLLLAKSIVDGVEELLAKR